MNGGEFVFCCNAVAVFAVEIKANSFSFIASTKLLRNHKFGTCIKVFFDEDEIITGLSIIISSSSSSSCLIFC